MLDEQVIADVILDVMSYNDWDDGELTPHVCGCNAEN
jgi:hypothetical protein